MSLRPRWPTTAPGCASSPSKASAPALPGWKQYQSKRPTEDDIRGWQSRGLLQNIGVVCGAVSGNLVVLDFDGPGAYGAFAALFSSLTETYTVRTGSGKGKHVYLYADSLPPTTRALGTPIGHIELGQMAATWSHRPASIQ